MIFDQIYRSKIYFLVKNKNFLLIVNR